MRAAVEIRPAARQDLAMLERDVNAAVDSVRTLHLPSIRMSTSTRCRREGLA